MPGATHLVTRRCSERRFFLRPSALTNGIFLYVLAVAARLHGIQVHAYCVLSNHYHLLVSDPEARLPEFMRYLDGLVARAPGLWSAPEQLGSARIIALRPKVFFRAKGDMPASAELELTPPPGFSAEEFQRLVGAALQEREDEKRRELGRRGFLGRRRVLAQSPKASPASGEPRRGLNPRIAARDKWKRIEAISRLAEFLRAYRAAWLARRAGVLDVVFPAGTYQLRVEHGVPCAPA